MYDSIVHKYLAYAFKKIVSLLCIYTYKNNICTYTYTGMDPVFSERGSKHRSGSLEQGIWGAQSH